ncbi:MAG: integrase core domain-containing protein [archaeon]
MIDDASRMLLVALEEDSPSGEVTLRAMLQAYTYGHIKQCISDHGSQFTSNNDGESKFVALLDAHGTQQILARIKHPQTNGKVEKWFDTYENLRDAFTTLKDFLDWYNNIRPHRSLNWAVLETPSQAFERKKKAEV